MRSRTGTWPRAVCDALIAVAAVLTVVVPRWTWFTATILPVSANVDGSAMAPQGTATGLYAHPFLWVAAGVGVVQLVLLLMRYYPGGRLRVPGDGVLLALGSFLVCLIVAVGIGLLPGPWAGILSVNGPLSSWLPFTWEGTPLGFDGFTLVMTWSYGATVAMAAALASLALTIAALGFTRTVRMRGSEPSLERP